ncbi:cyclic nucleotide-binding protein [Methylobacterium sp. 4-46]|uniref:cyclic nucleotide-binding domain-containing protein n=1 Tax=unclassified Methylobacterium TaxID=2615210 RepID=UPI000152CD1C|nr:MULTISPECIES: Crp/Fnr family transcriptional regulator [Methylobacterium]ACA15914.1 cyclic nucleotide-binding protein [Methylobacterium sp. 4-46]WFT81631.1 Crp/Fnr family transcriptional regulator [Methylobacterium nodulans]
MALDDDIAILAASPLFGLMPRDALRLISFAAEHRTLAPESVLFRRGEPADGGFVVLRGTIRLDPRPAGTPPVEAGPSALIGQTALFLVQERPTTARAATEAAVMVIPRALMRRVLEVFPETAAAIHDAIAEELTALTRALSGLWAAAPGEDPAARDPARRDPARRDPG